MRSEINGNRSIENWIYFYGLFISRSLEMPEREREPAQCGLRSSPSAIDAFTKKILTNVNLVYNRRQKRKMCWIKALKSYSIFIYMDSGHTRYAAHAVTHQFQIRP